MLEHEMNVRTMNRRKARNECMREGPTAQCDKLCIEVDKDSNDPKDLIIGVSGWRRGVNLKKHTDFYRDEHDDNLLEAFRVSTRHGLLQELQHILQNLNSGVE